jgi:hypothetical protein
MNGKLRELLQISRKPEGCLEYTYVSVWKDDIVLLSTGISSPAERCYFF